MNLGQYTDALGLLADESRMRLCALLRDKELCVTDLVKVTGIAQSRVSTHLGRLREAGFVRDRRQGPQSFYALEALPGAVRACLDEAASAGDPTLEGDRKRLRELQAERRGGAGDAALDELAQDYSPGRTWQSLVAGLAALLRLGDVLDVGSGDGAAAAALAPYCRSLTCIDVNARHVEAVRARLGRLPGLAFRAEVADAHDLPFADASFDAVLVFHTLTYAERPARVLAEGARVLRPGGRLVVLCLDEHQQSDVTARFGERHAGFSPRAIRGMLSRAGLVVAAARVAARELKRPNLPVVLAIADKPTASEDS